jgi:hypothetical protein
MLTSTTKQFKYYKQLADKTIASIKDDQLFDQINSDDNSIAIIVQHIIGNIRSRWTNIFTEDGEKTWRNRDSEFEIVIINRQQLLEIWEDGWKLLFDCLNSLNEEDLNKIIYIRNEGLTFEDAILRQLCHYSYHIGQIVAKGKQLSLGKWNSLSIPLSNSNTYNAEKFKKLKCEKHFLDEMLDKE